MRYRYGVILVSAVLGAGMLYCRARPSSFLQGQTNATVTFYGRAVDQDGRPLGGVNIEYQVDAYPQDWTFETRGRPYDTSFVSAVSGGDGRFQFQATGTVLRMKTVEKEGYRHLWEENGQSVGGYSLIGWGQVTYKTKSDNPAIFVMVKKGVQDVSALPSPGGSFKLGKWWEDYKPKWPRDPSLKDVRYVPLAERGK